MPNSPTQTNENRPGQDVGSREPLESVRFTASVDKVVIDDLQGRLERTRWPDELPDGRWQLGTDRQVLRELCEHWRTGYDWDRFVARCNTFPQFLTEIDDQQVHFVHVRSPHTNARPLVLTHGWPGSYLEFFHVIEALVDPVRFGGSADDAFHVVVPSLPGYGFSGPTHERGWNPARIARAWALLMQHLGYARYFVQGGDWGSFVSLALGTQFPAEVAAVHVNFLPVPPPADWDGQSGVTERERIAAEATRQAKLRDSAYASIQGTRPQTLAYGLTDSPAGLAGWMLEKFRDWSDNTGDVLDSFPADEILDAISLYWVTGTINSSMRIYADTVAPGAERLDPKLQMPLGHSAFPREFMQTAQSWARAVHPTLSYWGTPERGGHFAAWEQPALFIDEMRTFFGSVSLT